MGIYKSTLGKVNLSGCAVRDGTGDTEGGTTIEQCAALAAKFGVPVEVHTGGKVAQPYYLAVQLQAGRGFSLGGNCSALGKGNVNHQVWVNEARGGTIGHPASALVYDPWSKGPAVWAWSKVLAFAHALHPWGQDDPRTLASEGITGVYCGIFPDTEPHFHPKYGGVRTSPFPDHLKGRSGAKVVDRRLRPGPGRQYAPVATNPTLRVGQAFVAYQKVTNASGVWFGSHLGDYWVSAAGVTGIGGT